MSEPSTFRTRYDTILFLAGVFGLSAALAAYYLALILSIPRYPPMTGLVVFPYEPYDITWLAWIGQYRPQYVWTALRRLLAVGGPGVALALALAWQRVSVGEDGLAYHTLLRSKFFPWRSIRGLRLEGGAFGLFFSPRVVLRVAPQGWVTGWTTSFLQPCLSGFLNDLEGLVRQIVAHAPEARLSRGLQAYLDAPRRVSWLHRLPILVAQAGAIGLVAFALTETWQHAMPRRSMQLWIALAPLLAAVVGGAVDREWRWKWALVAAAAPLAAAQHFALVPMVLFGRRDLQVAGYAACLAWMAVAFVVCLPWRPRGKRVASALAALVLAATVTAGHLVRMDPLACRRTRRLSTNVGFVKWSPDGRLVVAMSHPWIHNDGKGMTTIFAVDPRTLAVRERHLVGNPSVGVVLSPDGRHVVCLVTNPENRPDASELWVWDTESDTIRRVYAADKIEMDPKSAVSPDHRKVVFRTGWWERTQKLFVLDLADLSVTMVGEWGKMSDFDSPRWRADGALLLVERRGLLVDLDPEITLWLLVPGTGDRRVLHRMKGYLPRDLISPDGRWVVLRNEVASGGKAEVLDLFTLQPPRLQRKLGDWRPLDWMGDSRLLAWVGGDLAILDPSSGTVSPAGRVLEEAIFSVPNWQWQLTYLSFDGRYVGLLRLANGRFPGMTDPALPSNVFLLETRSGRVLDPRQSCPVVWASLPVWSPVSQSCVLPRYDSLIPSRRPVLCFYDLEDSAVEAPGE